MNKTTANLLWRLVLSGDGIYSNYDLSKLMRYTTSNHGRWGEQLHILQQLGFIDIEQKEWNCAKKIKILVDIEDKKNE